MQLKSFIFTICLLMFGINIEVLEGFGSRIRPIKREINYWFRRSAIVPDLIDKSPQKRVKVKYQNNVSVRLGNVLNPSQVKNVPSVVWPTVPNTYYTLVMTSPDSRSHQNSVRGEINHWLVMNIPGTQIMRGRTLVEYMGSGPPKNGGLHRYVFLVFKQNGLIATRMKPVGRRFRRDRVSFKIREFAKQYSLGNPIGGNFFLLNMILMYR